MDANERESEGRAKKPGFIRNVKRDKTVFIHTTMSKDRAFLTMVWQLKFSSSPREELAPCDGRYESPDLSARDYHMGRVGRGLRRGAASKNVPPLPGPLLHPMEEREFGCGSVALGRLVSIRGF
jgi:hypothetical protein